jgi:hypothetical protein
VRQVHAGAHQSALRTQLAAPLLRCPQRTFLQLLADQEFHLDAYTAGMTYILAFGVAKAATNYLAGTWSDPTVANRCWLRAGWSPYPYRCS